MSESTIKAVRGMNDILPSSVSAWHFLEAAVRDTMNAYAYREMRTPVVEHTGLFSRAIGEVTDIVEREMYTFESRKGTSLTLRPEGTASCVRAAIQHGLMQAGGVNRIWYQGPMFRYERPQKGRTRQFHQTGAEVYGVAGAAIEAELILVNYRLWRKLGIDHLLQLELNTLGSNEDRARYREALVDYFQARIDELDEDSQRRLKTNPLRILDSKNPSMANVLGEAPPLEDYLGAESRQHFSELQRILDESGVRSVTNPRLVRGLDYYSHTVFEWTTAELGAQAAVCGGGRYDGLVRELSGRDGHAVGWALGMERLVMLIEQVHGDNLCFSPDVFLVVGNDVDIQHGLQTAEWLRDQLPGLSIVQSPAPGSFKSQFRQADKSGAALAVILGSSEWQNGTLTLKSLREPAAGQQTAERQEIVNRVLADHRRNGS